jgi:hypothetical protein
MNSDVAGFLGMACYVPEEVRPRWPPSLFFTASGNEIDTVERTLSIVAPSSVTESNLPIPSEMPRITYEQEALKTGGLYSWLAFALPPPNNCIA